MKTGAEHTMAPWGLIDPRHTSGRRMAAQFMPSSATGAKSKSVVGGLGNDTLTGGAGADTFVFDAAFGLSNQDRITDFVTAQGDKIALSAAVFTQLGVAGTPVVLGGDYLQYSTVTGALTYDADGVGGASAVTLVVLGTTTHPALTGADFVLIA